MSSQSLPSHDEPVLASVDGWPINVATLDDAVRRITGAAEAKQSFSVATLNLDHLAKLRRDETFRRAYRAARFVSADGAPVAILARRQCSAVERTTGADLVLPLCEEAARRRIPIFLFGSDDDALARAASRLAQNTEGRLDIAGTLAPPQGFSPTGPEADAALHKIATSGARLCFVALGAPKQEIFAARAVERGIEVGFVCIGAALDFIAGRQTRAPRFFRDHGIEWLWRLSLQPSRLAVRYAQSAIVLADIVVIGPLRHQLGAGKHL